MWTETRKLSTHYGLISWASGAQRITRRAALGMFQFIMHDRTISMMSSFSCCGCQGALHVFNLPSHVNFGRLE
jgi:hypothetical protein